SGHLPHRAAILRRRWPAKSISVRRGWWSSWAAAPAASPGHCSPPASRRRSSSSSSATSGCTSCSPSAFRAYACCTAMRRSSSRCCARSALPASRRSSPACRCCRCRSGYAIASSSRASRCLASAATWCNSPMASPHRCRGVNSPSPAGSRRASGATCRRPSSGASNAPAAPSRAWRSADYHPHLTLPSLTRRVPPSPPPGAERVGVRWGGTIKGRSPFLPLLPAIGFEAIAVGVDDEGGVVFVAVIGARPRLAVVAAARFERRLVEGIDRGPAGRGEADMQSRFHVGLHRALGRVEPERCAALAIAERSRAVGEQPIAQRLQRRVVEAPRGGNVANPERDMVEHVAPPYNHLDGYNPPHHRPLVNPHVG